MSMTVNGVTLPSIPASDLASKPFAAISKLTADGTTVYGLALAAEKMYYLPADLANNNGLPMLTSTGISTVYTYTSGDSSWTKQFDAAAKAFIATFGTGTYNGVTGTNTVIWSNCDIASVTAIDSDGSYTTSGNYFDCTLGTEGTPGANITLGTTTLSGIPSDILAIYPYALISKLSYTSKESGSEATTTTIYVLSATTSQMGYFSAELTGNSYGTVYSPGACVTFMTMDQLSAWEPGSAIAAGQPISYDGTMTTSDSLTVSGGPVWTNYNIYNVTSYDSSSGDYTLGDIYLSANSYSGGGSSGDATDEGVEVRLSIGYDLWKAIVNETRRLSGTIIPLNANEVLTMLQSVTGDSSGGGMITSNVGLTYASFASSKGVTIGDSTSNRGTVSATINLSVLEFDSDATGEVVI